MLKKVVALAITAGIAGTLVFGCSSSTSETDSGDSGVTCKKGQTLKKGKCVAAASTDDNGTDTVGDDDDDTTTKDASTSTKDGSTAAACYDNAAATAYTKVTYAPASAITTACTKAVVDQLATDCTALLTNPDAGSETCLDLAKKVADATCRSCLVGTAAADGGAARAGVFADDGYFPNRYGCIDIVGKSTTCGTAYGNTLSCLGAACAKCDDSDEDAIGQCQDDAFGGGSGACAQFGLDSACIDLAQTDATVKAACSPSGSLTADVFKTWATSIFKTFCGYN